MEAANCQKEHRPSLIFFILKYSIFCRQVNHTLWGLDLLQIEKKLYLPYKFLQKSFLHTHSLGTGKKNKMKFRYNMLCLCYLGIKNHFITKMLGDKIIFNCHLSFSSGRKAVEFSLKNNFYFQITPVNTTDYTTSIVFNIHNEPQKHQ